MKICGREVGHEKPPVVIAEAGLCHNGDIERALEMVRVAADAGCDIVKFQTFKAREFCQPSDPLFHEFKRSELPESAWALLKAECVKNDIGFLSTPQNRSDLDILIATGIDAIKVGSDDFCNVPLLNDYASEGLPMILSCGMSSMEDVYAALSATDAVPRALLVCTSLYPCKTRYANLARITTLREFHDLPIGFSDHTQGVLAASVAVGLGACIFEKHFTLDRSLPGPDHWYAADPAELSDYVRVIHTAYLAVGDGIVEPSAMELAAKQKYQRKPGQQLRGQA